MNPARRHTRAFTLIELLVTISVIALLIGMLLPALGSARESGRQTVCLSNLRSMTLGWTMYANTYKDYAMPLAYTRPQDLPRRGEPVFWWGTHGLTEAGVDHQKGFLAPFLDGTLSARSVFECPCQPWGSYRPQGNPDNPQFTSTYGYNGYFFSPSRTPGWDMSIGFRPWRKLGDVTSPTEVFVFADSLLGGGTPSNTALLDPPLLYSRRSWSINQYPTTAFRHFASKRSGTGSASTARADGSVRAVQAQSQWLVDPAHRIGSVGTDCQYYVPDAANWP
jgi:prepilin-type N-terminal cleavage/methylation domain-containing protein